jgi:tetratricopeptide (TPR) repeat protein
VATSLCLGLVLAVACAKLVQRALKPSEIERIYRVGSAGMSENDLGTVQVAAEALTGLEGAQPHVHMLEGFVHLRSGRLSEATADFLPARDHPQTAALAHALAGEALCRNRQFADAIRALTTATRLDESITDAHRWLAAVFQTIGATGPAMEALRIVSEQAPDDPRPHRILGRIYKDAQSYDPAIVEYREALRRDPNMPDRDEVLLELAGCLLETQRHEELAETIRQCPRSAEALTMLADSRFRENDGEYAGKLVEQALSLAPDHLEALRLRATMELSSGNVADAVETLRRTARLYPCDQRVRHLLSEAYARSGKSDLAEEQAQESTRLRDLQNRFANLRAKASADTEDAELRFQLGKVAAELGQPDLAMSWFAVAVGLDANHAGAREALQAGSHESNSRKASVTPQSNAKDRSKPPGMLSWEAIDRRAPSDPLREASEPLDAAPSQTATPAKPVVEPAPESQAVERAQASALSTQGGQQDGPAVETPTISEDTPEALRRASLGAIQRLIEDVPRSPESAALLALAHSRFGNHTEAAECWRRCLELDPNFADAWHGLGTTALEKGEYEESESYLRKALEIRPGMPEVRIALADALMSQGKMEEAAAVLEDDVKFFPQEARSFFRLGQAYAQLGDHARARQNLEAAVQLQPETAYPYYVLATVCIKLGDKEKAAEYRQEFARRKEKDRQAEQRRMKALDDAQEVRRSAAFFHLAAGNLYLRNRRPDLAERLWRLAGVIDSSEPQARLQLVQMYRQTNRTSEALNLLKELRAIEPENILYLVSLGQLHAERGDYHAAEAAFQEAVRIAPERALGYAAMAQLCLRSGRPPLEAVSFARTAAEKEPTAANYALLAATHDRNGDLDAAKEALRKGLALEPQNAALKAALQRFEKSAK